MPRCARHTACVLRSASCCFNPRGCRARHTEPCRPWQTRPHAGALGVLSWPLLYVLVWWGSRTTSGRVQNLVQCMVTWPHSSSRIMPAPWWLRTTLRTLRSAAGRGEAGRKGWHCHAGWLSAGRDAMQRCRLSRPAGSPRQLHFPALPACLPPCLRARHPAPAGPEQRTPLCQAGRTHLPSCRAAPPRRSPHRGPPCSHQALQGRGRWGQQSQRDGVGAGFLSPLSNHRA